MSTFDELNQEGIAALRNNNTQFPEVPNSTGSALDAIAFSGNENRFPEFAIGIGNNPFGNDSIFENTTPQPLILNIDEEDLESREENTPRLKLRVRFVLSRGLFEATAGRPEDHGLRLYAKLRDPIKERIRIGQLQLVKQVTRFSDSGISFRDIEEIYGVTLGKDIVAYVEEEAGRASDLAIRLANWMGLNVSSNTGYTFIASVTGFILDFASRNPSDVEAISSAERAYNFFVLMLELSILDLINTAEFLAAEVLKPLAMEIRSWKFKEERWNAHLGDRYDPLIKSPSRFRQDMLKFFNSADVDAFSYVNNSINASTAFVGIPNYPVNDQKESLKVTTTAWQDALREMLGGYFSNLEGFFAAVAEDPEAPVQLVNAFVVGVINGVLDLLARLVEDMASLLELINPEKLNAFIEGIRQFIAQADFKTLEALFIKELRQLFSFLDGDDIYTNVYEMGFAIAKFVEIIINVYFGVKGVLRLGAAVIEIGKEIPGALKAFGVLVEDLVKSISLKDLSIDDIRALKELGIRLNMKTRVSVPLSSGVPIAIFDGKTYRLRFLDVDVFESTNVDEVSDLLNSILDDPRKLDDLLRKNADSFRAKGLRALVGKEWEWTNISKTKMTWRKQSKADVENKIKQFKNHAVEGKQFEGLVADEVNKIDPVEDFANEVTGAKDFGDIDISTMDKIFEVKKTLANPNKIRRLEKQLRKYLDEDYVDYFNDQSKKVFVVSENIDFSNDIIILLQKKNVTFIEGVNNIKNNLK